MAKVSVVIPSRNEPYLNNTINDLLEKARGDVEVIAVLDGYWGEIVRDPHVHYIFHGKSKGLRGSSNAGVDVATGKYVMKIDAHCMFGEGYDVILAEDCEKDWVVVPRRRRLDVENWKPVEDSRPDIDYMYLSYPKDITDGKTPGFHGRMWEEKNRDESLKNDLIVDCMSAQGSCWFMHRDYIKELELFDEEHYGTFANEFQEIGFKCWLSGGRVVRNKKIWYAHWHKQTRGYPLSKSMVAKANEWAKKWATNDAWDKGKVKRDIKWLVDRFAPVPEWEGHDWNEWGTWNTGQVIATIHVDTDNLEDAVRDILHPTAKKQQPERRPKVYQNIVIDGVDRGQNPKRKDSKFWNEGKWDNFIEPLLASIEGDTFVEMGCDSGLFLQMAESGGFERVVGIDKSRTACKVGEQYRDSINFNYKILHRTVGVNFDFDEIPVADVTLLSTVHYYFDIADWLEYLDKLRWKTRYCLVVSRSVDPDAHWRPSGDIADVRGYFRDWGEVKAISDVSERGDPAPRKLWSMLFRSDLVRMSIDDIYIKNERHKTWVEDYKQMDQAKRELADEIAKDSNTNMEGTSYFQQWLERKKGDKHWPVEKIRKFVRAKIDLMVDVKNNGLKEPLVVRVSGQICDGGHRLAILRAMGCESVIVRIV